MSLSQEIQASMLESGDFLRRELPVIIFRPSERVQTFFIPHASNFDSDYDSLIRNISATPLGPDEIADIQNSEAEMANGESEVFVNLNDAFTWLDAD
jgi:hypothetical protein